MSACTACKWISSLPVFWRNAFIKGPQVRSGKKRWDWTMGDLAHGWFGPQGRRLAGNSGVFWSSFWLWYLVAKYWLLFKLWITGGTAQTPPSSSVSEEWMKYKMNQNEIKHPNPVQALLSALADYMFQSDIIVVLVTCNKVSRCIEPLGLPLVEMLSRAFNAS